MGDNLYAITSYYNPLGYRTRYENFHIFRNHLEVQGIPLIVVELATKDGSFQLPNADIQVRSQSLLWQKERLLNLAIDIVPADADAIAWLDCDIIFLNQDWAKDTLSALEDFSLVQPFEAIVRLPKIDFSTLAINSNEARRSPGLANGVNHQGFRYTDGNIQIIFGDTGFGWAMRADELRAMKLYDRCILGGGDLAIAHAALSIAHKFRFNYGLTHEQCLDYLYWYQTASRVIRKRITHVAGDALHLWHGELANRNYLDRQQILVRHNFNPATDLVLNDYGAWELAGFRDLEREIEEYFLNRKEDG